MKTHSRSHDSPFVWNKPLEVAWVGPRFGRGGVSGNYLSKVTCVIQFDGDSDTASLAFIDWEWGELNKGTMDTARTSVQGKATPPALALKSDNSASPCMFLVPLEQLPQCWSSEQKSPSVSKAWHGHFKRNA